MNHNVISLGLSLAQEGVLAETALPALPEECIVAGGDFAAGLAAAAGRPLLFVARNPKEIRSLEGLEGSGRTVRLPQLRGQPLQLLYYFAGDFPGTHPLMFGERNAVGWRYAPPGSGSLVVVTSAALLQYSPFTVEVDRTDALGFLLMQIARLGGRLPTPAIADTAEAVAVGDLSSELLVAAAALGCGEGWSVAELERKLNERFPFLKVPLSQVPAYLELLRHGRSALEIAEERGLGRFVSKLRQGAR